MNGHQRTPDNKSGYGVSIEADVPSALREKLHKIMRHGYGVTGWAVQGMYDAYTGRYVISGLEERKLEPIYEGHVPFPKCAAELSQ